MAHARTKDQAHQLIERMAPGQVDTVVGLLEMIVDPVERAIARAPYEDERVSDAERKAVMESKQRLAEHPGEAISYESLLAETDARKA